MFPAIFSVLLAVFAVACSGDDSDDDETPAAPTVPGTIITASTATPQATLETAPGATASPELLPEEQARDFSLIDAPQGLLQFTDDGPYTVPGDALGVFYLDLQSQQIEGWFDLVGNTAPIAFSGEGRFTLFERSEQVSRGGQVYPEGYYLGDRESASVYGWDGDAEPVYEKTGFNAREIAARGHLVLLRVPVEDGDDWFTLLNVTSGDVEAAFQSEGELALFSEDGARMAFAGWRDTGTAWAVEVWVVDLATGDEVFRAPVEFDGLDLEGTIELVGGGDGETFSFVANAVKQRFSSIATRFSWDGDQLTEVAGKKVFVSPGGEYVAALEPESENEDEGALALWHVFSAYDMRDGSPLFRVVGVDERFNEHAYNRWLADGSGIVVKKPDGSFAMAYRDGRIEEYTGVPSPTSPDIFAVSSGGVNTGTVGAVDGDGEPIVVISFQGGVRDFVDPWGDSGEEVRLLIPHFGHDGAPASATIVEPYVEEAPYDGEPSLQLSEVAVAFGLLHLYEEPGSDNAVGKVEAPYRVGVEEVRQLCHGNGYSDPQECPKSDTELPYEFVALVTGAEYSTGAPMTSYWARVTTSDGQAGWLLLQANPQGV